jgi:hypothetical protein
LKAGNALGQKVPDSSDKGAGRLNACLSGRLSRGGRRGNGVVVVVPPEDLIKGRGHPKSMKREAHRLHAPGHAVFKIDVACDFDAKGVAIFNGGADLINDLVLHERVVNLRLRKRYATGGNGIAIALVHHDFSEVDHAVSIVGRRGHLR